MLIFMLSMNQVGLQFGRIYKTDLSPSIFREIGAVYEPGGRVDFAISLAKKEDYAAGDPPWECKPMLFCEEEGGNARIAVDPDETFHIRTRDASTDSERVVGDVYMLTGKDAQIGWRIYRKYFPDEATRPMGDRATTFINWIGCYYLTLNDEKTLKRRPVQELWTSPKPKPVPKNKPILRPVEPEQNRGTWFSWGALASLGKDIRDAILQIRKDFKMLVEDLFKPSKGV